MSTVIEGVETTAQRDFLQSVGCIYVQGYFYAKPMPMQEYEAIVRDSYTAFIESTANTQEMSELDAFMSADPNTEAILRGLSVPVAIFEYDKGRYDRLRANQSYFDRFEHQNGKNSVFGKLSGEEHQKAIDAFERVIANRDVVECEVLFVSMDGSARWYRIDMKYIIPCQNGHIVCAVYTDITQEKTAEAEVSRVISILNREPSKEPAMLVVDDEETNRTILRTMFEKEYRVLEAANGKEALDILAENGQDVAIILLDMLMPELSGSEFLAIKNHIEGINDIPTIIISVDTRIDLQVSMIESGADDYITKPFVVEVVKKRVENVLHCKEKKTDVVRKNKKALDLSRKME